MSIRKNIPNAITSLNLLCGVCGVIFALQGNLSAAFVFMLAGAVFDFLDGLAARLLGAYSEIGKELDSLADDVTFGVLPAIMLYCISGSSVLRFVPLLIAAFSALRLAKFNIDERQHSSFLGLPTPASAMICGSLASFVEASPFCNLAAWCSGPVLVPVISLCLCALLVSGIPMFSMKFGTGDKVSGEDRIKRMAFLAVAVLAVVYTLFTKSYWPLAVLITFTGYVLVNLAAALVTSKHD